ncbi:MAG TPA: PQQ-dependent sugar dehydrogenase [Nitrospiraceae bacterium]|nr:PQQ-dependent sugar dehydrogenase [Nitrospiraceae bacterium]
MAPIQRLLTACLILVGTGCLIGCSGGDTQQNSTSASLTLQPVTTNLSFPVFMTAAPNDRTRLFIVEKTGLIRIFDRNSSSLNQTAFLNLSGLVSTASERGFLGMAFDSDYGTNRRFYVFYTNITGDVVIARYLRNSTDANHADSSSAMILLTVEHSAESNHNGGMLAFGPDGCLYAGIGDGGGSGDPNNNGQNTFSLLGKLLRLNPDTGAACGNGIVNPFLLGGGAPQVWSLGLRNPWRFSFDSDTGDLYIGDVGQNAREEIDVSVGANAGRQANYGWRLMEGFLCFNPSSSCNSGNLTLPVLDYDHSNGACSVIGGYAYRGFVKPDLRGTYFYADFCAGFVRSFRYQNSQPVERTEWPLLSPPGGFVTSFGEDAEGELYVMTQGGGLFKFVPN